MEFAAHVSMGVLSGAAEIAVRLAVSLPLNAVDQRIASGYLLLTGNREDALKFAQKAVELDDTNGEYALHLGGILNQCGAWVSAVSVLLRAAELDPRQAETFNQLAFAAEKLGYAAVAARLADRARTLEPEKEHRLLMVAHFLAHASRFDEAIKVLRNADRAQDLSAVGRRMLSSLLGHTGDYVGALEEIEAALQLEPLNAEHHLQRSLLLTQLARRKEAIDAVRRSIELNPSDQRARRHAVTVLAETGDMAGALRHGGELLALAPDDPEYLSCMRHLLETRATREITPEFESIAATKASAPPRPLRPSPTFVDGLAAQGRSIGALVLRDIRSRYGESRLGFLWALMEPFLHIGVLAIVFQLTMRGRPPIGDNFFFFYFTGVIPYLLISHLIMNVGHSVRAQRALLQMPTVTPADVVFAKSIVEAFTTAIIFIIFLGLFALFGVDPMPVSPDCAFEAFLLTWTLGFGLGMLCTALFEVGAVAEHIVGLILRLLYFASGIFYVPADMPLRAREILAYNPFLHIVDCMRVGFFRTYSPEWMDIGYAARFSLISLLLGMAALALMSRRMRSIA